MNSFGMSQAGATNLLSKSGSGVHTSAYQLLRPASHVRSLPRRVCAKAFTPAVSTRALHCCENLTGTLTIGETLLWLPNCKVAVLHNVH